MTALVMGQQQEVFVVDENSQYTAFRIASQLAGVNTTDKICFSNIWDNRNAKFEPCFLPVVAYLPAVIATLILLFEVLYIAISKSHLRPTWTKPFAEEDVLPTTFAADEVLPKRQWTVFTAALATTSVAGFGLELVHAITTWPQRSWSLVASSWLVIAALVLVKIPRTAPLSLLFPLAAQVTTQTILLDATVGKLNGLERGLSITCLILSSISFIVILLMPLRDPVKPAKEISKPFSTPTSSLRSPEDNLSVWEFMTVAWMNPLIRIGGKRQLEDEDVWQLGAEFQHRRLHENFRQLHGTVILRLLLANGIDLVILTILGLLELLAQYATPILLQVLLAAMEDPTASKRAPITYAGLTLIVRMIATQSGIFSLWFGRRCYERSRGEMITMLYEKTLGRKIAVQEQEVDREGDEHRSTANDTSQYADQNKKDPSRWNRFWQRMSALFKGTEAPVTKEPASMGKILNLMRNDVYEVAQRFWEFQGLITKPLSVIFSVVLVVRILGWPSLLAVLMLVVCQILSALLARIMIYYEKKRRIATDSKLQIITQFVEAIRHLRWYGWQNAWLQDILEAREKELKLRIVTNIWNILIDFVNSLSLDLTPVVAFFAYTVIAGKPLRIDIVFPAMQIFSMMNTALKDLPGLIIVIVNAWVAVSRIEDFMAEPDREEMNTEALIGDSMALEHASFAWPGVKYPVLHDVNVSFPAGLTVVCGEVASGKTALLQALLGELDMLGGQLFRPREPIGYCAQTPWLQSMNIRENILFSSPYEAKRYKEVLDACALTPDLAEFKAGDLSMIGENGIGLSGGQKARVALARAVYSRTKILLLDDPLSALDQQTAESIVAKCLSGPLLENRTVVLITHRTDLVLAIAHQIIRMQGGRAIVLDHDVLTYKSLEKVIPTASTDESDQQVAQDKAATAIPDKFIEDEHRAHGSVKAAVYWEYVKAGTLRYWGILVVLLIIYRTVATGEAWFLKVWGEAYDEQASLTLLLTSSVPLSTEAWPVNDWPSPRENVRPWLIATFLLAITQSLILVITRAMMILIVYTAAKRMFHDIMEKVAGATFRFYDVTPVGRLMNRMTSDISVIDGNISMQFRAVAWLGISWISAIVVIASVTPAFLVFSLLLTAAFILIFLRFLPTSQSLRRLEMVSLTPLMSNFGALLNGLTTVRAFSAQNRFQDRVIEVVDTFQKMDHFYWSLQAWLTYRYDALSALSAFLLTMLALATNVSPGLTAFVLFAANKYVNTTHGLCRQYGQLQMEFVSVERIVELLHLEQEPKGNIMPPAWWPSFSGDIVFDRVLIKYAPHLDPALAGISFTVKGGSKTAVIGRTGSGKSTLALAILATILPEDGNILVDNINLAEVDKQLLRTRITFLAQDPVLFPGSMQQNLDPVSEHTNEACENVLRRVCARQGWSLDTKVEGGGKNLSQGQRQLVGLARAVLRRSAIIILDEATASIDRETATQIQQILHEDMKDSTVITIAHRLEAVRNADYCVVLGKGKIVEQGPAEEMLKARSVGLAENADE
nr:atp-dependent bile acid permease [Quercus suber]